MDSAVLPAGKLQIRTWSAEEFAASRRAWGELLHTSDADPLFMSWDWQWRWWLHHAGPLGATLRILAAYAGSTLVGLVPFYSRQVLVRGIFPSLRWEFIGIAWRDRDAVFSDYLDMIVQREHRNAVLAAIAAWLASEPLWDELVLCCTRRDGAACEFARSHLSRMAYVREIDPLSAWCAQLPPRLEHYIERLASDARRKMFNHRRKLVDPRIEYAAESDIPDYLGSLWSWVSERWGRSPQRPGFREFHLDLAACMAQADRLRLSRLSIPEGPLSFMYNIRTGDTIYYLQSAFDATRGFGLSPGYLHFGYAIEAAYREGAARFDLLAGPGRHRDYKPDLLTERVPVVTYHAVRGAVARVLYRAYELASGCRRYLRSF